MVVIFIFVLQAYKDRFLKSDDSTKLKEKAHE